MVDFCPFVFFQENRIPETQSGKVERLAIMHLFFHSPPGFLPGVSRPVAGIKTYEPALAHPIAKDGKQSRPSRG